MKWYRKLGYAFMGPAGNIIMGFVGSFAMIYFTDVAGLKAGVVATLIMVAKMFDGFDDLLMGSLIDRTRTKWGKARPWFAGSAIPLAVLMIMMFNVPADLSDTGKNIYVFLTYLLVMDFGYSTYNIAGNSLIALITKNRKEQIDMNVMLYLMAMVAALAVGISTIPLVAAFGGGAAGYRTVAMIYAAAFLLLTTISVLNSKELPQPALEAGEKKPKLFENFRYVARNKYFWIVMVAQVCFNLSLGGVTVYYAKYVLHDEASFGLFAIAMILPMFIGTIIGAPIVKKFGMRAPIVISTAIGAVLLLAAQVFATNLPFLLVALGLSNLMWGPWLASMTPITVEVAEYNKLRDKKDVIATIMGTTSLGAKLGAAVPTALVGWMLDLSGYVPNAPEQAPQVTTALIVLTFILPGVLRLVFSGSIFFLKVEKANKAMRDAQQEPLKIES